MLTKTDIISAIILSFLASIASLSENNGCSTNDNTNGTCKPLPECKSALKLLRNNSEILKSLNCGFEDKTPKVCCTENSEDNVVFENSDSTSYLPPTTTQLPRTKLPRTTVHLLTRPTTTAATITNNHGIDVMYQTHDPKESVPVLPSRPVTMVFVAPATQVKAPPPPTITPTLVTRRSYLPDRSVCGQTIATEDRILGGTLASIGEFPWSALLKRENTYGCMGTLINENFILTAAHCVPPTMTDVKEVRLGEWDLESDKDCDESMLCSDPVRDVPVRRPAIIHPNYTRANGRIYHDIAMLQLVEPVQFTDFIRPICLPTTDYVAKKDYLNSIKYTAAGWGKTEFSSSSVILRKVELASVDIDVCRLTIPSIADDNVDDIICAGGLKGEDTCNGDSGSGLVKREMEEFKTAWFLYGITSYGSPKCGSEGVPGVYTRVTSYMGWILDTIAKSRH